jgi:hypothetical protein
MKRSLLGDANKGAKDQLPASTGRGDSYRPAKTQYVERPWTKGPAIDTGPRRPRTPKPRPRLVPVPPPAPEPPLLQLLHPITYVAWTAWYNARAQYALARGCAQLAVAGASYPPNLAQVKQLVAQRRVAPVALLAAEAIEKAIH